MPDLKADAEQIKQFLHQLASEDWVRRSERRWWPKFVFHYTDMQNAVRILQEGYLYSRKYLEDTEKLIVSSGSPTVLLGTDEDIKDCVRLYFRPKTPTQYYAEGVHSQASLSKSRFPSAHCPVPIFLLFDAAEILTRTDCQFSDKGLGATNYHILYTAEELSRLPWQKIYHTGWISPDSTRDIVPYRMAEIIIPRKLDLSALRFIYCRSEAEKDTLLHLMPVSLRERYQSKILATTRSDLFIRRQTFIQQVTLLQDSVSLQFSPDTESPGPFQLQMEFTGASGQTIITQNATFTLQQPYKYTFPINNKIPDYHIRFLLDNHLVYANAYEAMNFPF